MKKITKPHFLKRLIASMMDGLLFVVLWLSTAVFLMPLFTNPVFHKTEIYNEGRNYQLATHLYIVMQQNDSGGSDLIEVKDYTTKIDSSKNSKIVQLNKFTDIDSNYFVSHLQYYYLNFLTGEGIELPIDTSEYHYEMEKDHFVSPHYNETIKVDDNEYLPKDIYTLDWFKENILENKEEFILNEETKIYQIKEGVDKTKAVNFIKDKIIAACSDFYYSDFYKTINRNLTLIQLFEFIPTYIFFFALIYLLFPMIFKNGETLGKLTFSLGLVNKNGYKVTRPQILLRFLFFFLEITLGTFLLGILDIRSLATLGIVITALLIATLVNKKNRSLHDFVAGTMVVDLKESIFFKNANEEAEYEENIAKDIEKYSNGKIVDAHIIQVGSKIVDEDIKKELDKDK